MSPRSRSRVVRLLGAGIVLPASAFWGRPDAVTAERLRAAREAGIRGIKDIPEMREFRQTEADWRKTVLKYAKVRGWHWWSDRATNAPRHCWKCGAPSKAPRNPSGHPDLLLIRRPQILWAELKAQDGDPTPAQVTFIEELRACGQQAYVWRPSDWPDVQRVLG